MRLEMFDKTTAIPAQDGRAFGDVSEALPGLAGVSQIGR